ncbi:MAG TPA: glycoside hydrolase family 9 protein [Streptosporangiaceae bacterium]|nr:glycoside hydrolase family 9 protein [Streptosporangiaceae bacterium]
MGIRGCLLSTAALAAVAQLLIACAAEPAATASHGARAAAGTQAGGAVTKTPAEVRVNQVGYPAAGPKVAYVMLPAPVASVAFTVSDPSAVVFRGSSTANVGGWNARYHAVYALNFSALTRAGTKYRIHISAAGQTAQSPAFVIGDSRHAYGRLATNAVAYFTSERDGPQVKHAVLDRQPANLTDEHAYVYASPKYDSNDNLLGTFHRIGGPVNVAGGWFDAGGGYEKFAYTATYADGLMQIAQRDFPRKYPTLGPEASFGLRWLRQLWNPRQKVMYIQVGIGNGNASNTIQGDYNFWFLPQAEDKLNVAKGGNPGPSAYYVKYRPVFAAAAPGSLVSPELAGRFAADFGLGAQLTLRHSQPAALQLLSLARGVYAMAQTTHVTSVVTTFPHDYYGGTEWKSDMLWGAAELALADEALGAPARQVHADLLVASQWARAYIAQGHPAGGDTLNLYDNGAIAEGELLRALRQAHGDGHATNSTGNGVIGARPLLADLGAQLRLGERLAKGDPFGLGGQLGATDASPHAFGLYITNALYREYGGGARFDAFAQQQLNFALGANGWGSSFAVGAGTTYPQCMQSEIANLAGSLTGAGKIQLGAVTVGPNNPASFVGLGTVSGMRPCSAGSFGRFNTKTAAYEDNVVSWPSVEPASDYVANSLLAFAFAAS